VSGTEVERQLGLSELRDAVEATRVELSRVRATLDDGDPERQRLAAITERLASSVLRPLADVVDDEARPAADAHGRAETLWRLAVQATVLRAAEDPPHELLEATAALQDLAVAAPTDDSAAGTPEERLARFRELLRHVDAGIQPAPDGPYLVTNAENLRDHLGCELPSRPQMALCRCGQSAMKPYCDGSHASVGFTDEKSPDRIEDRRDRYVGQQVTVLDNRGICQHSGFCTDRLATVFRLHEEPFVHPSGGRMDEIIRAVRDCPSGALSYALDEVEARDAVDYHGKREPTIEVTQDGPYRVTGGLALQSVGGRPVERNEGASLEHYALCRCGQSQNKPFCSGMHWYVDFHDPVPDPDHVPTMFEWAGGFPALQRMTRLFYEKYVPQDPMLAPLFANMSADHPQRVAKWLGEVFGGPKLYSDEYGGYPRMLSQHIGKGITEEWRGRWVQLLLQSAREAGLPNDPEFRSAFQAYIEWGSRLAVENSQATSRPPEHMPMPHWDWTTAAGPPGSRISALAARAEEPEEPVVLPAADEPVRFEKHIRPLFRRRDRDSMKFAFDLWSYEDVRAHADAILQRLHNGSMPCDGAWPAEHVDVFERWITAGMDA
jgi:CDGSH-type Zn-finger protein/truncated hemoglobin YjbI